MNINSLLCSPSSPTTYASVSAARVTSTRNANGNDVSGNPMAAMHEDYYAERPIADDSYMLQDAFYPNADVRHSHIYL